MTKLFDKIIKKYEQRTVDNEVEIQKLMKARYFYMIRRPDFLGNIMLLVSVIPVIVSVFVIMFFMNDNNASHIGYVAIGVAAVCSLIIAPIVVKIKKLKTKELNYLANGKSKDEIIVDDFNNYYERLLLLSEVDMNTKTIEEVLRKESEMVEKKKIISNMKKDVTISAKEKDADYEVLEALDKKYKEEFEHELKRLAIVNFFEKCFKQDVLNIFIRGMMIGVIAMLIININMITGVAIGGINSSNVASQIIFNVLVPAAVGFISPAIVLVCERYRLKNALQIVYKQIDKPLDFNKYPFELKKELEDKLDEIEHKIVVNTVNAELLSE